MLAQPHFIRATFFITPLQIASDKHCQQVRADSPMVSLIELPCFQKRLEYQNQWSKLRVLFLQKFDEFYAVYAIRAVEGDVDVDISTLFLELNQMNFGVLQRFDALHVNLLH